MVYFYNLMLRPYSRFASCSNNVLKSKTIQFRIITYYKLVVMSLELSSGTFSVFDFHDLETFDGYRLVVL